MAGGSTLRRPNQLWGDRLWEVMNMNATTAPSTGQAGLTADPPLKRRLNLTFIDEAPDASLDFTPQPGPRVKPQPGIDLPDGDFSRDPYRVSDFLLPHRAVGKAFGNVTGAPAARVVQGQFDNLTFWDRITKSPEWERAVQGVEEIREAETVRAAKPDAMQAAALKAEADYKEALAEADRLEAQGKYTEAEDKRAAATSTRRAARDASFKMAKTDEIAEAQKKAADWIKNAKKKKAEVWADRKKGAVRGGIIGGTALGLGVLGNEMMEDWLAGENASPENQAANEIMNRILMGGETTPEEDALVIEKLGSEEAFLKLKDRAGSAAPAVEPTLDPTAAPSRPPGPPLRDPTADLVDVAYREGAEKPQVPEVEMTYDPDVHAAILADPEGGEEAAALYADQTAAEDLRRRANALTDAGIENTAAAAGMPDGLMEYLREQGEYARAADAGAAPVSDNWWNNLVAKPMQESLARAEEINADPITRKGSPVLRLYDSLPEWARGGLDIADSMFNPITIGQNLAATTSDEFAAIPYQFARNTLLGPGAFTGLNDEAFGPVYAEALRSMGGETLGADPVTAPITEGAAPIYGPTDMTDMGGGMGVGTGTGNAGMPSMEDLAALERIGALGVNPDGSNMTVAQYIQQGNLAGAGMEPALPMFSGADLPIVPRGQPLPPLSPPMGPDLSDPGLSLLPSEAPVAPAPAAIEPAVIEPGGQGDQYADAGGGLFGPAQAGTMPEEDRAKDDSITSLIENDEVSNPPGQMEGMPRSPRPLPRPAGLNEAAAPPVAATEPVSTAPATGVPATTGSLTAPGTVGDFNASREVARTSGPAGLAEDAADAEAELNWINRMMRDKLGLDASQRAKAADALISGGAAMLASRGNGWQAFGEGVQAGLGSVQAADAADAEAAMQAQEMAIEDARWRQEMALEELRARSGGGGGLPDKIEQIQYLMAMAKLADPNITEAEAYQQALERVYSSDGLAALVAAVNQ